MGNNAAFGARERTVGFLSRPTYVPPPVSSPPPCHSGKSRMQPTSHPSAPSAPSPSLAHSRKNGMLPPTLYCIPCTPAEAVTCIDIRCPLFERRKCTSLGRQLAPSLTDCTGRQLRVRDLRDGNLRDDWAERKGGRERIGECRLRYGVRWTRRERVAERMDDRRSSRGMRVASAEAMFC